MSTQTCPKCGYTTGNESHFCANCGYALASTKATSKMDTEPKNAETQNTRSRITDHQAKKSLPALKVFILASLLLFTLASFCYRLKQKQQLLSNNEAQDSQLTKTSTNTNSVDNYSSHSTVISTNNNATATPLS